jgi:hypothetical protein
MEIMPSGKLLRASALGALVAGVGLGVAGILVLVSPTLLDFVPLAVGLLGMIGGLAGLHARQAGYHGRLGQVGFVLVLAGDLLYLVGTIVILAGGLLGGTGPVPTGFLVFIGTLLLPVGFVVLGAATLRARVLPPWGGWILIIDGVFVFLMFLVPPLIASPVNTLGGSLVLFAVAWLALSYALWPRGEEAAQRSAQGS